MTNDNLLVIQQNMFEYDPHNIRTQPFLRNQMWYVTGFSRISIPFIFTDFSHSFVRRLEDGKHSHGSYEKTNARKHSKT